jgi:hypothetical protein
MRMLLNQDGTINAIGSMPNYPLEVPEFIEQDAQPQLWKWDLVGDIQSVNSWSKTTIEIEPIEVVKNDIAFGNQLIIRFLTENKKANITTAQSLSQLGAFMNVKMLLEAGAIKAAIDVLQAVDPNVFIVTPGYSSGAERKQSYIDELLNFLQ